MCLGCPLAWASGISGMVLDSKTKMPINNVNVYIKNTPIGTMTNEKGYFNLSLN